MALNQRRDIGKEENRGSTSNAASTDANVTNPDYIHDFDILKKAIINQDLVTIEKYLKHNVSEVLKHFEAAKICTPLHLAAKRFRKPVIELLVKYGHDVNATDRRGNTPLFIAIQAGAFLSKRSIGASRNCEEVVEFLLQLGADPNISDKYGKTPLHFVASYGDSLEKSAKLLLNHGADVNVRCYKGKTPFYSAIENENISLQLLFLEHMVHFKNAEHRDILRVESEKYSSALLEACLESGADINSVDENGTTTLGWACDQGYKKLVISLLEHGSDVSEFMAMKLDDRYSHLYIYRSIKNVLKRHITKLIVAGLNKVTALYISNKKLVDDSRREWQSMEKYIPHSAVRFCDVLTEDATKLATYARNESMVKFLMSRQCKHQFPLYWSVMKGFMWRGIVRKCLLEKSINVFRSYGGMFCELPDMCVEHILSFFSDEDLRVFIQFDVHKIINK